MIIAVKTTICIEKLIWVRHCCILKALCYLSLSTFKRALNYPFFEDEDIE